MCIDDLVTLSGVFDLGFVLFSSIMRECWREDPESRHTFETLQQRLEEFFTEADGPNWLSQS